MRERLWFWGRESESLQFGNAFFTVILLPSDLRRRNFKFTQDCESTKGSFHTTHRSSTATTLGGCREELPSLENSELSDTDPTLSQVPTDLLLIPPSPSH